MPKAFKPIVIDNPTSGAVKLTQEQVDQLKEAGYDLANQDQIRGHMGPYDPPSFYGALCMSYVWDSAPGFPITQCTIWGPRRMHKCKPSGFELEGRVSVEGTEYRAFTSSTLFELPSGHLVDVAVVVACLNDRKD